MVIIRLSGSFPITVLIFFLVFSLLIIASRADDDDDSASIAKLAAALDPLPKSWSNSSSYCEWKGVKCNGTRHRHVVEIHLNSMSLKGYLPSNFPPFPQLELLNLSYNLFTGSLPLLNELPLLKLLDLSCNKFTSIPPGFFERLSPYLQVLTLSNNPFLAPWRIPIALTRLRSLTSFYAQNTNLEGSIPDIVYSLDLTNLSLSTNNLTGNLPSSLGRSHIKYLWLDEQKLGLGGTIDILSYMTSLFQVWLGNNRFSGIIPDLSNSTSLELLELNNNNLTGVVPQSLVSHPSLEFIALSYNKLQGPSPSFGSNTYSYVYNNNFCRDTGSPCDAQVTTLLEIASAFGYPYKLSLAWEGNDACKNWSFVSCNSEKNITTIDFQKQQLKGTISQAFASLTAVEYLYLNDNNLTGPIPDSLTKLAHLKVLNLSNNNLSGVIPTFQPSVKLYTNGNYLLVTNTTADPPGGTTPAPRGKKGGIKVIFIVAGILGTILGVIFFLVGRMIARKTGRMGRSGELKKEEPCPGIFSRVGKSKIEVQFPDLQLFGFGIIATATNNFDPNNKLGKGGFGLVYKGKLQDGQEIAVKRLLRASTQGTEEFMNEAVVISKLQHRNLVRLLGCCIEGEEKMLVYEYMPNKSLDIFLFDSQKQNLLDWRKRFSIIEGISRGLLYLHRDSRLRIVHRDLKASNILLDRELNPKISDFGIAKIFGGNRSHENTRRVFGTYGYMSPEYAMKGQFSEKSDVFSFGVLTLEIVSGRRNSSFHDDQHSLSLLEYAWKLWSEDNILALVDPVLILDPSFDREISRCIHVGLLCVQNFVKDRPTMSTVASMLTSEIQNLPTPMHPPFIDDITAKDHSQLKTSQIYCIIDNIFNEKEYL